MTNALLDLMDEAFDRRSWHGTNLRGSIRGLTPAVAAWRPAPDRHNIWELVVHAAYWKYEVRRRLTGAKRGGFALSGRNFWPRPQEGTPAEWKDDVALLVREHAALRTLVAAIPTRKLGERAPNDRFTYAGVIRGIAAHDLYHAGQIQLLKAMVVN
jgi:hypothetical protein